MTALIDFFFVRHDLRYVIVAGIICLCSSYACISLVRQARAAVGQWRLIWSLVAALAVGFGIWSTHFIAMLGFRPGFLVDYHLQGTLVSLAVAVVVCGFGLYIAANAEKPSDRALGGAIVGVGIVTMHFTGMLAIEVGGSIAWNGPVASLSLVSGIGIGAAALVTGGAGGLTRLLVGSFVMTLAICAMHFTAMAAADFSNCFTVLHATDPIGAALLTTALTVGSLVIIAAAVASILFDNAARRRRQEQSRRERADQDRIDEISHRLNLALEHIGQALCLFDKEGRIVVYNRRLPELLGLSSDDLTGQTMLELNRRATLAAGITDPAVVNIRAEDVLSAQMAALSKEGGGETIHLMPSGRALRVRYSPVGDGSWVMTIEDITDRRSAEAKIAYLARYDALTGLPNRDQFVEMLDFAIGQAGQSQHKVAVVAFDLDHFSDINDAHGAGVGDRVLAILATRMRSALSVGEMVARLGGDGFGAIKTMNAAADLEEFLPRLLRSLTTPVEIDNIEITLTACMGVSIFPDDAADGDKLIADADLAILRAKADGPATVYLYDPAYDEISRKRRDLAHDMASGLPRNEFFVVYQVQRAVVSGDVIGYEALLRWNHPKLGLISPIEFIPIAEQSGLIGPLGQWVLETACREAVAANLEGRIAVNLSPLQLGDENLPEAIADILLATGMSPARLELEVTETALIAGKVKAMKCLHALTDLGISIALDDFGTGYSSLETLRCFPWAKIKLDRSFVAEIETSEQAKAIMRAVIGLGKALLTPVLAEGVETDSQLDILRRKGCDDVQGYLFGRPVPIAELIQLAA